MAYTKNPTWVDGEGGGTRIDAADLQNIEDGLFAAAAAADDAAPSCRNAGTNSNFADSTTGWTATNATLTAASNVGTMTATASGGSVADAMSPASVAGRKYYVAASVQAGSSSVVLSFGSTTAAHTGGGAYERLSLIHTATTTAHVLTVVDNRASGWTATLIKYAVVIDLTTTFGSGNEPTKSELDYLLSRYTNSWFGGTVNSLVNAAKHYLRDRIGSGSPEGVVTAPVGTNWTDILDTCGATKWVKKTGTGNTGWEVSVGDTKWRNISNLLINGWTGTVNIRRINGLVELRMEALSSAAATSGIPLNLPVGFGNLVPTSGYARFLVSTSAMPVVVRRGFIDAGVVNIAYSGAETLYGSVLFTGSAAWSTALPGSPGN